MDKIWKYFFPVFISGAFVMVSELGYYYLILAVLLIANILNYTWGELSNREVLDEIKTFYGRRGAKIKRISAVALLCFIFWALWFTDKSGFSFANLILFGFCTGCLSGCFIVTLAHDMLHGKTFTGKVLSSLLLISVNTPHLAADHIFGHHRLIGLKEDTNTAPLNQNFYVYFFRLSWSRLEHSFFTQFQLPSYVRKKILKSSLTMLAISLTAWALIIILARHPAATLFFFIFQGFIAYFLYELINYIQHYGLKRKSGSDDITQNLSWNCYYKYTNYILYLLPLHSLHHLPQKSRKINLTAMKAGPRMPYLYFVMVGMALIPKIWFWKMNPLAIQYNKANENVNEELPSIYS